MAKYLVLLGVLLMAAAYVGFTLYGQTGGTTTQTWASIPNTVYHSISGNMPKIPQPGR